MYGGYHCGVDIISRRRQMPVTGRADWQSFDPGGFLSVSYPATLDTSIRRNSGIPVKVLTKMLVSKIYIYFFKSGTRELQWFPLLKLKTQAQFCSPWTLIFMLLCLKNMPCDLLPVIML